MAATDFVTEAQIDSLTTNVATEVKTNKTAATATATALSDHLTDAVDAHDASAISIADAGTVFTATDVEGALQEVKIIADAAAGGGTSINDAATETTSVWSSSKTDTEIASQASAAASAAVDEVIGAASGAADTLKELEDTDTSLLSAIGNRVRFDAAQALSGPQQAQVRANIGVVDSVVDFAANFNTGVA